MSDTKTNPLVITYGDFTLDFTTLPQTSLIAMLRRGVSHYFGSEQASKVTAYFDPEKDEPVADTPEARATAKAEFQAKAHDALLAGTVGVSVRGPTVDPITVITRRLAKAEVVNILKSNGVKPPAKADDKVETPDGSKFTMAELIDRRIAREGERLGREAKKIADEQARKAKKAEETAKAEGLAGL